MRIVYLHGFNSSAQASTLQVLRAHFGTIAVGVSYDYINADRAHQQIQTLIAEFWGQEEIIFVGTSLGGFWANYFAQRYGEKCVLINPSLRPSESLKKYIGENANYKTGEVRTLKLEDCERYRKYEVPINRFIFRSTLLGTSDTVIDLEETRRLLEGTYIQEVAAGHRIEDKSLIISLVEHAMNTYPL